MKPPTPRGVAFPNRLYNPYIDAPPRNRLSGRPITGSHHMPVMADGSAATSGSSRWARYLWHTIDVPSSTRRTCQNIVLPENDA